MSGDRRRNAFLADALLLVLCIGMLLVHVTVRQALEPTPGRSRTYWYDPRTGAVREIESTQRPDEIDDVPKWARRAVREALEFRRQSPETER